MSPGPEPKVSVVLATYNRLPLLRRLLEQLAMQTVDPNEYEVVVVDDGSVEQVPPALRGFRPPYALSLLSQANAGAAAARHKGVTHARGDLLIITDDDMQVNPDFLQQHLAMHPAGSRRAVLGRICADPAIGDMPFFERWYAHRLDTLAQRMRQGDVKLRGNQLYTGNVSMRRTDYLGVGGFDPSLKRSEDAELGLRLEASGVEIAFSHEAVTLHGSDHTSQAVWLKRAFLYGVFDSRISAKHAQVPYASPWRFLFRTHLVARPFLAATAVAPRASRPLSMAALAAVHVADRVGLQKVAFAGSSLVYTMEYFRGVRNEAGSLAVALRDLAAYVRHSQGA